MMGEWRPVCDDGWDVNAATVVCKEHNISTEGIVGSICVYTPKSVLVFTNAATIPMLRSYYSTEPSVHYWLDDIRCNGDELSLLNCTHAPPGVHDCGPYERAGVACETTSSTFPCHYYVCGVCVLQAMAHRGLRQSLFRT